MCREINGSITSETKDSRPEEGRGGLQGKKYSMPMLCAYMCMYACRSFTATLSLQFQTVTVSPKFSDFFFAC